MTLRASSVVLYCAHPTAVQPYIEIAKALSEEFSIRPVLLLKSEDVAAHHMLKQHLTSELQVRTLSAFDPAICWRRRLLWRLNQLISRVPLNQVRSLSALVQRIEDCRARSLAAIEALAPALAVVPDDRRPAVTLPFLDACRRYGLPVLLHSGALLSSPANIQTRRLIRSGMAVRGWRAALARRLPTGAREVGDHTVLFFDLTAALAMRLCGLRVRNPWVMGGSGYIDHLATQGESEKSEILADPGWKPVAVSVVGTPTLDGSRLNPPEWHAADPRGRQDDLAGLAVEQRPLAVFAVPQRYSDAPNFTAAELQRTVDALIGAGFGVLLSLHPKSRRASFEALLRPGGYAAFADAPLSRILHRADLFLASYSSTITWAGALGIASAVIDFHEENSPLYKDMAAVPILRAPSDVTEWARSMSHLNQRQSAARAMKSAFAHRMTMNGTAARDLAALCADLGGFRNGRAKGRSTA